MAYFTPLGPLRPVGPRREADGLPVFWVWPRVQKENQHRHQGACQMPYWTSQKQSRNVTQRGNRSSPERGGPAEEGPSSAELSS